ncbi:MAG: hypothetical protein KUG80_07935 [Gammaproteobacteria bacterium]|nr:hypothetical protein [Gammaproteobacteria bacterium]
MEKKRVLFYGDFINLTVASVFSIDVCAYAVMSNHYHLVLFMTQDELNSWSDDEIVGRWGSLFPASTLKKICSRLLITPLHGRCIRGK